MIILDRDGRELFGRELTFARKAYAEQITTLLRQAGEKINGDVELINDIHLDMPCPFTERLLEAKEFGEPPPARPRRRPLPTEPFMTAVPEPKGFSRFFGGKRRYETRVEAAARSFKEAKAEWNSACREVEASNATRAKRWEAQHETWTRAKAEHDRRVRDAETEYRRLLETDVTMAEQALSEVLQGLDWPRETLVSFHLDQEAARIFLDVDLPEIEDLPQRTAKPATNGNRLIIKDKSQKQLRLEYARHIHGICLRLAAYAARTLPWAHSVVVSGYSQRTDPTTGNVIDEYLLSVRFTAEGLEAINYDALHALDPVEAVGSFEHRRKMTSTGVFRAIAPFDLPE